MTWRAIDSSSTEEVRLPDEDGAPVFTIGFWPPREDVRLRAKLKRQLSKPDPALDPVKDQDEYLRALSLDHEVAREAARWGCRGWTETPGLVAKLEPVMVGKQTFSVLSEESLDALYRNNLLVSVAVRAVFYNVVTEAEKKVSGSPSPSPSPILPTSAAGATPPGDQKTTSSTSS